MRNTKLRRIAVLAAGSALFTGMALGTAGAASAGGHRHGDHQGHGQSHGAYSQSSHDEDWDKLQWLVAKWLEAHDYECSERNVDALANALDDTDTNDDWDNDGRDNDSDVDLDLDVDIEIDLNVDLDISLL